MLPRVKCLLVDDLDENLLALSALLQRDDVELLQARSGAAALELLLVHDVALALIDVQMPDMDGFELAELMRGSERTRHVPLIFVTAGARDANRVFKGYESGAVDFLYKPIEPRILQNKVDVFLQLHRQKQQLAHDLQERTETLRTNEVFMAVLGHDLRNPLSAMMMSATLMKHHGDGKIELAAQRMLASGRRMSRMIEDLLDLARTRLGNGIVVTRVPGDLGSIVQRVLQECNSAYPGRATTLESRGDLQGEWDEDRMAQVASNLISNALQHGEAGAPVQVELDGAEAGMVRFCVTNDGHIPEDRLAHLFDPFRPDGRHGTRSEGLGLGLYIVQQIVRAHGGSVKVSTPAGVRTRFEVAIPRHRS